MQKVSIARAFVLFTSVLVLVSGALLAPVSVEASGATCLEPVVGNFTPYVYSGELQSFEYTVDNASGTSYLPLSVSINGEEVDLLYVSVWRDQGPNRVLVHVDVPDDIPATGNISIDVGTIQITDGPPPICITADTFHVKTRGVVTTPVPPVTTPETPTAPETPTTPEVEQPRTPETPTEPETPATTTPAGEQCSVLGTGWLILLAVLDIIVSAVLLLFMALIVRSNLRLTLAVLIPPVVFIGIWYIFNSCHSDVWFPILSVILAIIVLIGSGTPDVFEGIRVRTMRFFGKRTNSLQLKLSEATSIMERR